MTAAEPETARATHEATAAPVAKINSEPDLLYHYCSTASFLAIVSGATIRASDMKLSNDSTEGTWSEVAFRRSAEKRGLSGPLLDFLIQITAVTEGLCAFCLSEKSDSLSQWRGYADDGNGFCIGFDKSQIYTLGYLTKVFYSQDDVDEWWGALITKILKTFEENPEILALALKSAEVPRLQPQIDAYATLLDEEHFPYWDQITSGLWDLDSDRFKIKHPAFDEEAEWRLITYYQGPYTERKVPDGHHAAKNRLVPYVELPLGSGAIRHVRIGPKNITPEHIVKQALAHFPDATVEKSVATYR